MVGRRGSSAACARCSSTASSPTSRSSEAGRGDALGNLVYRRTARDFNPVVAMAGRVTIAEVEVLVEVGELDGDHIHTPVAFVQRVVLATAAEKPIERLRTRQAT
jgi:3-oxoacid CoA-transferase subunit A